MRTFLFWSLTAVAIIAQSNLATAQSATGLMAVLDNCQNPKLDADLRIEACTQMIHANIASHGILAAFYNNRGAAYEDKHDTDHAMQDYEKALQLKPDFAEAQANRDRLQNEKPIEAK